MLSLGAVWVSVHKLADMGVCWEGAGKGEEGQEGAKQGIRGFMGPLVYPSIPPGTSHYPDPPTTRPGRSPNSVAFHTPLLILPLHVPPLNLPFLDLTLRSSISWISCLRRSSRSSRTIFIFLSYLA